MVVVAIFCPRCKRIIGEVPGSGSNGACCFDGWHHGY